MSFLRKAIENNEIHFEQINLNFNQIKESEIYQISDCIGRNVLYMTRENPELSLRLIKELGVEYQGDGDNTDVFESLDPKIIQKYYDLDLHKYTCPPKTYFDILIGEEIEDVVCRYKDRQIDLFIDYPNMLRFCEFAEYEDYHFFEKVCHYPGKIFSGEYYAIEVAIYYGYSNLFQKIPNKSIICLTDCENWEKLDEDSILYLSNQQEDPESLLKLAFEKCYKKIIKFLFSQDVADYYVFNGCDKYYRYTGDEKNVDEDTYKHLIENYPDYRGFSGKGLLYICLLNNFKPFPEFITDYDLEDAQKIEKEFTEEQIKFLFSYHDFKFSLDFRWKCNQFDKDTFVKFYDQINDILLKEKIVKILIEKNHRILIEQIQNLDVQIKLEQKEYDYLSENFPKLKVKYFYNIICGLYTYGIFHNLENLAEYNEDFDRMAILTIVYSYGKKHDISSIQKLFDLEYFEQEKQKILILFKEISSRIGY